jgi:hypothetical protein
MLIIIGRLSGPSTDNTISTNIGEDQLEVVQDILAIVNACTDNKERWFMESDDKITIPKLKSPS